MRKPFFKFHFVILVSTLFLFFTSCTGKKGTPVDAQGILGRNTKTFFHVKDSEIRGLTVDFDKKIAFVFDLLGKTIARQRNVVYEDIQISPDGKYALIKNDPLIYEYHQISAEAAASGVAVPASTIDLLCVGSPIGQGAALSPTSYREIRVLREGENYSVVAANENNAVPVFSGPASRTDTDETREYFVSGVGTLSIDKTRPYESDTHYTASSISASMTLSEDFAAITNLFCHTNAIAPVKVEPKWSPSGLSGVVAWFKADAIQGVSNNGTVANWMDSSGSGNNAAQATTSIQPLYKTNSVNGLPALQFDGVDDLLRFPQDLALDTFSTFIVASTVDTIHIDTEFQGGTYGAAGQHYVLGDDQAPGTIAYSNLSFGTNGISNYEHGSSLIAPVSVYSGTVGSGFQILEQQYVSRQETSHLNGMAVHTGVVSSRISVHSPSQIGGMSYGNFSGGVAEVILLNRSITTDERQRIEGYLALKYGLQSNLPSDHPYKSTGPE